MWVGVRVVVHTAFPRVFHRLTNENEGSIDPHRVLHTCCGHQIEAIEQSLKAGHVCVHLVDAPERHYVFQSVVSQIGKYFSIKEHDLIIHFPRRKQHSDLHRQASHVDHLTEVEEVKHRMTMNNDFPVQLINLNQDEV